MPSIEIKESENFEVAIRRFRRTVEKAGVIADVRKKEFYLKPTTDRKIKRETILKKSHGRVLREKRKFDRLY